MTTLDPFAERYIREKVIRAVRDELYRQDELWGTARSQKQTPDRRLTILMEEVGEYARDILERKPDGALVELIQVAAVAIANAERLSIGADGSLGPDLMALV